MKKNKKIVFIVNVDWFFLSHRLQLAKKAINEGYEVFLISKLTSKVNEIEEAGIKVFDLPFDRSRFNFIKECFLLIKLHKLLGTIKPDIVHCVTIKPVLYGGIIGRLQDISLIVLAISGLGHVFVSNNLMSNIRKILIKFCYKIILANKRSFVICQNKFDFDFISSLKRNTSRIQIIKGSGVDLKKFHGIRKKISKNTSVLMASRIIREKGVLDYIEACKIVSKTRNNIEFLLAGPIDEDNPSGISINELMKELDGCIHYLGNVDKMHKLLQSVDIFVLPSYREGLPKICCEAASCGIPIITSNVPGCTDSIIPDATGYLVPARSPKTIACYMTKLIDNSQLREEFGKNAQVFARNNFDINMIISQHLKIYNKFCNTYL